MVGFELGAPTLADAKAQRYCSVILCGIPQPTPPAGPRPPTYD
jgi:hypothetical protein